MELSIRPTAATLCVTSFCVLVIMWFSYIYCFGLPERLCMTNVSLQAIKILFIKTVVYFASS